MSINTAITKKLNLGVATRMVLLTLLCSLAVPSFAKPVKWVPKLQEPKDGYHKPDETFKIYMQIGRASCRERV